MGLLDIPAPLFTWLETMVLGALPAGLRLGIWAVIGGALSMGIYHFLSPQERLARLKSEVTAAQKALAGFEGEIADLWPIFRRTLQLSFTQLGLALGPAIAASLPVLVILIWASTHYDHAPPAAGTAVTIETIPAGAALRASVPITQRAPGQWQVIWPAEGIPLRLYDANGVELVAFTDPPPARLIHKRTWWNVFIGNPAGYLPDTARIERLTVFLPERTYLPFGPPWLRTWEALFFLIVIVTSLTVKVVFRIH